jgi:hypothetical protein
MMRTEETTSLVALAFVGGLSRTGAGQAFYIFGLALFPSLVFLGLATFERVLQSGHLALRTSAIRRRCSTHCTRPRTAISSAR